MKTIRAIFRDGTLQPLDPVDLPENTPITVALLDGDDLPADAITELAGKDASFQFLNDPREDIYSESDGEALQRWPGRFITAMSSSCHSRCRFGRNKGSPRRRCFG